MFIFFYKFKIYIYILISHIKIITRRFIIFFINSNISGYNFAFKNTFFKFIFFNKIPQFIRNNKNFYTSISFIFSIHIFIFNLHFNFIKIYTIKLFSIKATMQIAWSEKFNCKFAFFIYANLILL
jgi:hypothetical protein